VLGAAVLAALPATGWAARDRTPPTQPKNLRVVSVAPYGATLAWTPSTDNTGVASYVFCCVDVNSQTAPGNVSTFVYTAGLRGNHTYTLRMYAVDAAGNYSKPSNFVTFTTPRDTVPPDQPRISVTGFGTRHVSLLWSGTDNGSPLYYSLFINGQGPFNTTRETGTTLSLLAANTTYSFTVRSRDLANLNSPMSDPATVTTNPPNPDDVTPPSTPTLSVDTYGDCEVALDWSESTDDLDPQWLIEYQMFVNGVYDGSTTQRVTHSVSYGNRDGSNTFEVVAIDTAGNRSGSAEFTLDLPCPFF
jgi:chitodextrinase